MMKSIFALSVLTFCTVAFAHGGGFSTKEYCSKELPKICAHAHFTEYPETSEESQFIVHVEGEDESKIYNKINVELWMDMGEGHGHGSAPVEIAPDEEENHFDITNAWFPMMGEWQIKITVLEEGVNKLVVIPVQIKE
jgi:hypothetical protein